MTPRSTRPSAGVRAALTLSIALCALPAHAAPEAYKFDRSVLPIAEPRRATITTLDVRKATAPRRFEVSAPKGAPNVVVVLLDDLGFASQHVRRRDRHADAGPARKGWPALQGKIEKVTLEVK